MTLPMTPDMDSVCRLFDAVVCCLLLQLLFNVVDIVYCCLSKMGPLLQGQQMSRSEMFSRQLKANAGSFVVRISVLLSENTQELSSICVESGFSLDISGCYLC